MVLTTSPAAAFAGQASLVVGCERNEGGSVKLYLDSRYRGIYLCLPVGQTADEAERAWRGSHSVHLWLSPVPPIDALFCDEADMLELGRS